MASRLPAKCVPQQDRPTRRRFTAADKLRILKLADACTAVGSLGALLRAEGALADSARYPRTNMVARIEGGRPGPTVHFNSHIDVVAPGQGWTVDPFAAIVRDGRIYGRGSCDMKGGLAASIVAVEAIAGPQDEVDAMVDQAGVEPVMAVSMPPGTTLTARSPRSAYSRAIAWVNDMIAPLLAE